MRDRIGLLAVLGVLSGGSVSGAGTFEVQTVFPVRHAAAAHRNTTIRVTLTEPADMATVTSNSFRVFGRNTGPISGTYSSTNGDQTVVFAPDQTFVAGDLVTVTLANSIKSTDTTPFRSAGFVYQFMVEVSPSTRVFTEIQSFNVRTGWPGPARIYGGQAVDLNSNGYADLAIICEDSSDVRVYLNAADGTGLFGPRLDPPPGVGGVPSPNEAADFNNDGEVDICTGNFDTGDVTVLLGTGGGLFGSRQDIDIGGLARGIAAVDLDGDGDQDIACASNLNNTVAIMINDGSGTFAPAVQFDTGGNGEYGLAAADMNNDGIMDLVVGHKDDSTIRVALGNGDATFTPFSTQSSGGSTWVVVCGDLDGDGNVDATTANSFSNNGAVLMGDGTGALSAPVTEVIGSHTVSSDLGDLDGDGDLDWIISSYGAGLWRVLINDGDGNFSFDQEFDADNNPACSIAVDLDNDGAIDVVLLDEIADTVRIMRNTLRAPGDADGDGDVDLNDYVVFVYCHAGPDQAPAPAALATPQECLIYFDTDDDSDVDLADFAPLAEALGF